MIKLDPSKTWSIQYTGLTHNEIPTKLTKTQSDISFNVLLNERETVEFKFPIGALVGHYTIQPSGYTSTAVLKALEAGKYRVELQGDLSRFSIQLLSK